MSYQHPPKHLANANNISVSSQQGIATILVILMISLAMTVAAMGVMYTVRSNQQLQVAAHANTNAQADAWAGVEVFRKYLYQLADTQPEALADLSGELPIAINGLTSDALSLNADVVNVAVPAGQSAADTFDITVNITAQDATAKASSVIQVGYRIAPYLCAGGPVEISTMLDFYRDLDLGGGITVERDDHTSAEFFVDGSVSLNSISVSGIDQLAATEDIILGSAVYIPEVRSNGSLRLTGGASVGKAYVMGTIQTEGNGRVISEAYANGNINLGGGPSGRMYSLGDIANTAWANVESFQAAGDVTISGGSHGDIGARGDVNITSWINVGNVTAQQDINCPNGWTGFQQLRAAGALNGCGGGDAQAGVPVVVPVMDEIQAFSMTPVMVDAWALKSSANYVFEFVAGEMQVTVTNVHGVSDGAYHIGANSAGVKGFLCDQVSANGTCTAPAQPTHKICNGHSDQNRCFSYNQGQQRWDVDGKNMAPGVAWFEGDLNLGNGEYYNTFIATGDISTSGGHKTYSINFAGYDVICDNRFIHNSTNYFAGLYPTNFCDMSAGELISNAIGNIGMLAGGYSPADQTTYQGGNITLGASTEIFGTVMAGNYLFTGGDTEVHGYINANGLGAEGDGGDANRLGGSTTVDLTNLPPSFNPIEIPNMGGGGGACNTSENDVSRVYWSRYL
ncbi:hypothetical protein [Teredinibacter turnerae]|uniref:hypothetical protein n=1 Tax=Teredinibacter turnerae TaxID=2426 RepID=UPI00036CB478|nr:hypothetical protein [Teredinibacter turnerae]